MERINVISSSIKSIGYESNTLEVEFKNRSVYHYRFVPLSVYNRLMNSPSKGSFLAKNIKRNYNSSKVR